jgi:hypothetical protein
MRGQLARAGMPVVALVLWACAARPPVLLEVTGVATDKTYGYSQHNPIKVGGASERRGPEHLDRFFRMLRGPQGEPVSSISNGSCCAFRTSEGPEPLAYLEVFLVSYKGIEKPAILYLDTVHLEAPKAPVGFTVALP